MRYKISEELGGGEHTESSFYKALHSDGLSLRLGEDMGNGPDLHLWRIWNSSAGLYFWIIRIPEYLIDIPKISEYRWGYPNSWMVYKGKSIYKRMMEQP